MTRLYPALLKFWRQRRGMSQLDLAIAAEVSSRHLSFLETARALPSREMVLRLAAALDVSMRDQNVMLKAAGFEAAFQEPNFERELSPEVGQVFTRMLAQHEPFPLVVVNRNYDVLKANRGAERLFARFIKEARPGPLNVMRMLFDEKLGRSFVLDWERVARMMLGRLMREVLARPNDDTIASFARELCSYPNVPSGLHQPDFATPSEPAFVLRLRRDDLEVNFLATITTFNAPQNVTLDELRIDSYFPLDDKTVQTCTRLAQGL